MSLTAFAMAFAVMFAGTQVLMFSILAQLPTNDARLAEAVLTRHPTQAQQRRSTTLKTRTLLFTSLSLLLLWTMTAVAAPTQKEHALKVGKKGEITLTQPTKVGNVVLQPDTYVVHQFDSGSGHLVRFVELKRVTRPGQDTYTEAVQAGEIKCSLEAAPGPIKQTTAYFATEDGSPRITKIAIKGEDVLHDF